MDRIELDKIIQEIKQLKQMIEQHLIEINKSKKELENVKRDNKMLSITFGIIFTLLAIYTIIITIREVL